LSRNFVSPGREATDQDGWVPSSMRFGGARFCSKRRGLVSAEGEDIKLRSQSLKVFCYLVAHSGEVVSKDALIDAIWPDVNVTDDSLVQCIGDIRRAIGDESRTILKTVPRRGYVLVADPTEPDEKATTLNASETGPFTRPRGRFLAFAAVIVSLLGILGLVGTQRGLPVVSPASVNDTRPRPSEGPSIAVLPFANLSGDPEQDYFADGITEDIITGLRRTPDLLLIARSTNDRNQAIGIKEVAHALGVQYVLLGSVRKDGEEVRITAQLALGETGQQLWSQRFDEAGPDIFDLQDQVTQKIVNAIAAFGGHGEIWRAHYRDAWETRAVELREYDYFLRAHSTYFGFTKEAMMQTREICLAGLDHYPDSALLRVLVGWTHWIDANWGFSSDPARDYEEALRLADEVLQDKLAPPVAAWKAHWLMAFLQSAFVGDHRRALVERAAAIDLFPGSPEAKGDLASIQIWAGQKDEAIEVLEEAVRSAPDFGLIHYNLAEAYYLNGHGDQALAELSKVPWSDYGTTLLAAAIYSRLGRMAEARGALASVRQLRPDASLATVRQELPHSDQTDIERFLGDLETTGLQ
jgi:TolB-like protein/DNA-binding winged helix-turn-helix (wHTH) protein